jgi:hypothetical protein
MARECRDLRRESAHYRGGGANYRNPLIWSA